MPSGKPPFEVRTRGPATPVERRQAPATVTNEPGENTGDQWERRELDAMDGNAVGGGGGHDEEEAGCRQDCQCRPHM